MAAFDSIMVDLVDYVYDDTPFNEDALQMARFCLLDSIGCAVLAAGDSDCTNLLVNATFSRHLDGGIPIIASRYKLGPIEAAFHIGSLIRWLEFNDTWLAQEWGHPSDNLGAILSAAAWSSLQTTGGRCITMADILDIMVRTYEVHGILCMSNCFNALGLDHVILVKIASAIAAARLLGLDHQQALNALSNAIIDGHSLRTYRHAPNAGTRKSWAAGDATARGLQLTLFARAGEMGYPSAVTAPKWGFNDAILRGKSLSISRPLSDFVIQNILFKVPNPAEYHAQTAVEAALRLRNRIAARGLSTSQIDQIRVETQRPAIQIIDKSGPLTNAADRDHCLQYMIAVALCSGDLTIDDFQEPRASDPLVDTLRAKIQCAERPAFTDAYYDPDKRAIPNALHVTFRNSTEELHEAIDYPLGHVRRRNECLPALIEKFHQNLAGSHLQDRADDLSKILLSATTLDAMPVLTFLRLFAVPNTARPRLAETSEALA
ncbi:bifunctional 2-methylcitrate dehydratase/aconitate hydratase [Rubrivivax sp. JA1024]|nr:bifunctional 2-methylcitrate dehydratase/aconitate hydratase [Rubrivivax sp. JA1024]